MEIKKTDKFFIIKLKTEEEKNSLPREVTEAANKVRDLKANKASKEDILAAVEILKDLKAKHGLLNEKKEKKKEEKSTEIMNNTIAGSDGKKMSKNALKKLAKKKNQKSSKMSKAEKAALWGGNGGGSGKKSGKKKKKGAEAFADEEIKNLTVPGEKKGVDAFNI